MLLFIAAILVAFWIIGLLVHIGGALIHIVLVVALAVAIVHFVQRRKASH